MGTILGVVEQGLGGGGVELARCGPKKLVRVEFNVFATLCLWCELLSVLLSVLRLLMLLRV